MTSAMEAVDLLAFGPHPDDIEIGIGATLAKHASLGHRVGLCDLTAGEMGSNGTIDERLAGQVWVTVIVTGIGKPISHTRFASPTAGSLK